MIFPLTAQGAITGSLFVFIPSLGNFVVPELLGGGKTARSERSPATSS